MESRSGLGGNLALEPRNYALANLFEGYVVYVVPNYQRLYVWSEEDQWEPLWSDVQDIASELVRHASSGDCDNVDPDAVESHFLGAVVLKISGATPDLARQLRVIDGQQRLTTLQILMGAAVNELDRRELTSPAKRLRGLIENPSEVDAFKIRHQRHKRGHDYERFGDVMSEAILGIEANRIDGPMAECFRYFQQTIKTWLDTQKSSKLAGSALATTLIMKLNVVGIYLDTHEKEHIIFETLNARGEPLTEWDKIKNYLLYKAGEDPSTNQESFFETYLDRFDEPWWRELVGRGIQRPRSDIFADYWLESKKKTAVTVRRVFREFQKYAETVTRGLDPMIDEYVKDSRYFRTFEEPGSAVDSRERLFHNRRVAMGAGAIWPLLLQLQRMDIGQEEHECCLSILESYLIRRMIVGYQARSYDQVALDILVLLSEQRYSRTRVSQCLLEHLQGYTDAASLWPTDQEVKGAVLNRHLPQYAQRLVLSALEQCLITDKAGYPQLAANLHVEHVMPRAWHSTEWPLPDSNDLNEAVEERNRAINTLGNLTLLNGRLNASISNGAWEVKQEGIAESDNLFLNRRLLKHSSESWTEADIRRRGEFMNRMILEIWPRG